MRRSLHERAVFGDTCEVRSTQTAVLQTEHRHASVRLSVCTGMFVFMLSTQI